jgi:Flp pilus assembly protein TadD
MTSSSASSIQIGSYQLFERVGEGASGQVHRGRGPDGADVAVKLLGPHADLDDGAARARFEREIRLLSELDHPSVVRLLDHGDDAELGPYLVTRFLPGATVRARIAGAAVGPEAALLLLEQVAGAAAALHAVGLVHRDLKPENLMLTPEGRAVVVDLGLAYRSGQTRYTDDGQVVGSVPYMAPEQIEGRPIDAAVDVWALGVMTYEWLGGRRPFQRERPSEEAAAALVGSYTPASAVDRRVGDQVAALVADCLRADSAARPTAAEVEARAAALIDWCDAAGRELERAALAADPAGYSARVAPFRVRRLRRRAREALAAGQAFAALAVIDRGLAYAPDDAELIAMAEEAERSAGSAPERMAGSAPERMAGSAPERMAGSAPERMAGSAPERSEPRPQVSAPRRWWPLAVAAAVSAVSIAAIVVALTVDGDPEPPAPMVREPAKPATQDDRALEMVGTMFELFERGMAAEQAPDPDALPDIGIDAIPLEALPEQGERLEVDLALPDGQPLVPPSFAGDRPLAEAAAEVEVALADRPGDRDLRLRRLLLELAAGDRDALARLDRLLEEHPDFAAAWAARGVVDLRRGRYADAEASLSRAVALDRSDAAARRNRGILRHRIGRIRDAYADLVHALALAPDDVDALAELARLHDRVGRLEQARPLLERLVALRPDDPAAWLDLAAAQPVAAAETSVRRALELDPESSRAHQRLCVVRTEQRAADAVTACERAVSLTPGDHPTRMNLGMARHQAGDHRGALAELDRAVAAAPKRAAYRVNRAQVRRAAGDERGARADLDQACALGLRAACSAQD